MDQYIKWNTLAGIIFVNCHFDELDLLGKVFRSCDFNHVSFQKCQFSHWKFEHCQIMNSDLTRAEFDDSSFRNSQFLKSDLAASDFRRCELIETTFKNSNLDRIVARDLKWCKSNEPIEIKMSSNFKEILKNLECVEE